MLLLCIGNVLLSRAAFVLHLDRKNATGWGPSLGQVASASLVKHNQKIVSL